MKMTIDRRHFLAALSATTLAGADDRKPVPVATNQYPWFTYFAREKRDWNANVEASLADVARSGLQGLEPLVSSPEQVKSLIPLLRKHGLDMRSLYVSSKLHDPADANRSIETVLAIGEASRPFGCHILVTNPDPLGWAKGEGKSDAQLETQAKNLDKLGAELARHGQRLAYHNHDMELKFAARELHHMMLATDPAKVFLCLDAHWMYRGAGNSQVALFDIVKLYGKRVVELHLRQSREGVWSEVFGKGDIDYIRLSKILLAQGVKPHLVLEQAVEGKSPNTMTCVQAHGEGVKYVREVFGELG